MKNTYPMKCHIRAEADVTRIDIFDDIGEGGWFSEGLTAKSFAAQMATVKGPLDVHINSYGGEVADGIAIANTIRNHKGPKKTVVDGFAASIASVIAQAGDERIMEPGSMMMIHDAISGCYGNAADLQEMAGFLDKHSDNLAEIYASRAGGSAQQWRDTMRKDTWYTADEAVAAGLADKVGTGTAVLPAGMDVAAFTALPGRIAAALRTMPAAAAPKPQDAGAGHDSMTGSHAHPHPAYGSQGADGTHSHDHSHDGDASHQHDHGGGDGAQGHAHGPHGHDHGTPPAIDLAALAAQVRAAAAEGAAAALQPPARVLGIESMPLADKALPVHHTDTVDETWDGPAAVKAMPADAAVLTYCHAWQDSASDDGTADDPDGDADDKKGAYKFPHHKTKGGPANLAACRNGKDRLAGADIPDGDRAGVEVHLDAHLKDGGGSPGGDDADGKAETDLSGIDLDEIRSALKGARA